MSSKLFTAFILIIYLSVFVSAKRHPCNSEGKCKYGGTCGPDNTCYCSFTCTRPTWTMSKDSMYCPPAKHSRNMKPLWNICHVMARACELQEDIPLIKMDFTKPKSQRCQAKNTQRWHLCRKPEDFMGPCGGTLNRRDSDSGVCLQDSLSDDIRCECPTTRIGEDCQQRKILLEIPLSSIKADIQEEGEDPGQLALIIVIASAAGVFLGLIIFASLRYRAEGIRGDEYYPPRPTQRDLIVREERELAINSAVAEQTNSRSDSEIRDHSSEQYEEAELGKTKNSYVIEIDAEINTKTPTEIAAAADIACPPRRQRLNGFSVHGRKVEVNNNHTVTTNTEVNETSLNTPNEESADSELCNGQALTTDNKQRNARSSDEIADETPKQSGTETKDGSEEQPMRVKSCNKSAPSIANGYKPGKHENLEKLTYEHKFHNGMHTL